MKKREVKTTEHDKIVKAMAKWLEEGGYQTFKGKKLGRYMADLVGVKSKDDTIAVEVKSGSIAEIRKGLAQAHTYLDWVHEVYLAIPDDFMSLGEDIAKHTRVGLLTNIEKDFMATIKDAERVRPAEEKLLQILSKTTGFCWLCGRTFNVVPRCKDEIYIAHKRMEPKLHKSLEKALKKKSRTTGSWAEICIICSRILGIVAGEFMYRITTGKKKVWVDIDTGWFDNLISLLVKRIQKEERKKK